MPKPRDPYRDRLPMAVLSVLTCGELPAASAPGAGRLAALRLKYDYRQPDVAAELRGLWRDHRDEILEAAEGREPWAARVLRAPDGANDDDDEGGER